MDASIWMVSGAVFISATTAIFFRQRVHKLYGVFKPLTTVLIIGIAMLVYRQNPTTYSQMMIPSLVFALVGDVFLLSKNYFLHGLASFLLAHIGFTIGFVSLFGFGWFFIPLFILVLIAGWYFYFLSASLGKYLVPVGFYLVVILMMNWQAIGLILHQTTFVFWSLAIASLLFSFSDSIIAYKKFKQPFRYDEILILTSYWLAIFVFALVGWYL